MVFIYAVLCYNKKEISEELSRDRGGFSVTAVYYIEDDENIAGIVKEYLEERDYAVSVFRTLEEGKRAFERQIPELALVDWNMPDGEGDVLLRWIRSRWRDYPDI